jgi:predicted dehydrogenase
MSTNPLRTDSSFAAARVLIAGGGLGQRLAVYAVARARDPLSDPLSKLGMPLIDELIAASGESPDSVSAVVANAPGGFEHWSLVLAFPSGLRASVDLGAGMGPGQPDALELRVEWSGTERALLIEPGAVAVTVTTGRGVHRHSAEVTPIATALLDFEPPEGCCRDAAHVIAAARNSFDWNQRVTIASLGHTAVCPYDVATSRLDTDGADGCRKSASDPPGQERCGDSALWAAPSCERAETYTNRDGK